MNLYKNKNNVITYTVNKEGYNDLYISVQNGEVIINAPLYMATNQIQKIVEEKKQWIINKLNEYEEACEKKKEYTKLDTIRVLGMNYELAVKYKMISSPCLSIEDDRILVTLPHKYKRLESKELIEMLINKMYNMVSKKEIERAMEKTRILMQIAPDDFEIKDINGKLAKCENKRIIISPKIAMYNRDIIEYIVLHEFCHLRYKNHTKSFYDMIATYMPEYEKYEKEIQKLKF